MKLYHGSNVEVRNPRLLQSDRRLDFGTGFYLTSSLEQASKWALLTAKRRGVGVPLVSVFDFDESVLGRLRILSFEGATLEWLNFVGKNRRGDAETPALDIVVGPVANDNTMPVLKLYFGGVYNESEAIRRLLPQKLKDQYAFKTQEALSELHFYEVIKL